ncbi:MAG: AraC family transcriptional regulator [Alphaproteobacteria bacterium]
MLNEMSALAETIVGENIGIFDTNIRGVRIFRLTETTIKRPFPYNASIVIVLRGKKIGYIQDREIHYNDNNYLVLAAPIPLECRAFATPEKPLVGISIDINLGILQEIWRNLDPNYLAQKIKTANFVEVAQSSPLTDEMKYVIKRLLNILSDSEKSKVLGDSIVKELYYQVLKEEQGEALYALANDNNDFTKLVQVLIKINNNIAGQITVGKMAEDANMSIPSFHRKFKKFTGDTPVQFFKKARLSRAKSLIDQRGMKINEAAQAVGYESYSQFSREFKRVFGYQPRILKHRDTLNDDYLRE